MPVIFEHMALGFCWWDLLVLILLVAVTAGFVWKHHDYKKQQRELEDRTSDLYANDVVKLKS